MPLAVEIELVASVSYGAFRSARQGSLKWLHGEGQWLYDLLPWEGLSDHEQEVWQNYAGQLMGVANEMDGRHVNELAKAAINTWIAQTRMANPFAGPAWIGLIAFCKSVCLFVNAYGQEDDEDAKEDIEDLAADSYDWMEWGFKRQQQEEPVHG